MFSPKNAMIFDRASERARCMPGAPVVKSARNLGVADSAKETQVEQTFGSWALLACRFFVVAGFLAAYQVSTSEALNGPSELPLKRVKPEIVQEGNGRC
ncbi:hypothetical protein MTO96_032700 [Rhipicephalus appendiculatus]